MAHLVVCAVCGVKFDRDKVQAVKHGARRYAHYTCDSQGELVPLPAPKEKEKSEEDKILDYCKSLFGDKTNYAMIKKQIKQFKSEYNYSDSGILKSLTYWYEVKKNGIERANGAIAIVPYIYQNAFQYYYSIWEANQKNETKDIKEYIPQIQTIKIHSPRAKMKKKKRFFSFLDDEGESEE